ncbi:MAG: TrmH family RNA methyltransferase [Flavobacteriaceae bacterium]
MAQLTHYSSKFKSQSFPITVICENVTNAPNIGSLFRVCDAFGVERIVFSGEHLVIPSRKMQKTSRATEKYVPFEIINNTKDYLDSIAESHHIIAIEITDNSTPIQSHTFNINKPIAVVIGDENFGISETILENSNTIVHIEMFGKNSSMNVIQAANIALYELTKQMVN